MVRFSLSSKIAILAAVLLVSLGSVMVATFGILSERQVHRTIEADAAFAGRQLNLYIEELSNGLKRQARFAAEEMPRIKTLIFLEDSKTISKEIPGLTRQFSVDAVQIVNSKGAVWGESAGLSDLARKSIRVQIEQVIESGQERNALLQGGTDIYLISCVPVKSGEYVRGAISLLEKLGPDQAKTLAQKLGEELGLLVGGKLVASSVSSPFEIPEKFELPKEVTLNGDAYVSVSESIPGTDPADKIGFVILRPTRAITAPYAEARSAFINVLAISLILTIIGAVAVGRGITKPIASLVGAARQVQAGEWPETFKIVRQDEIGVLQASFNDMITSARLAQVRLLAMIDNDPLTELRNHRSFRERLSEEARRCEATDAIMTLALIDVDGFDKINETLGRNKGDDILRQIADVLRECVPDLSILARYAGDQFAALLPNTDADAIAVIMNFVRVRLKQERCPTTVSAGCSEYPKNSSREDGLILAAELALERAKQLGKNRVCLFDAVPGADQAADPFLLYHSLESGSFATIQALAAAVDAKDNYTNGHSERVARYAARLSTALGDPPEMVDRVSRCGTLHDVGKIGVPDTILKKAGPLDPEEQLVMQTHAVLGELIASKVPQLADLLPGVRNHHERWDGSGYPDGLVGENIPYMARILAVVDTYDAMTSDRPYRKGLGHEIALEEIRKASGKQFDPQIAMVFIEMYQEPSLARS